MQTATPVLLSTATALTKLYDDTAPEEELEVFFWQVEHILAPQRTL